MIHLIWLGVALWVLGAIASAAGRARRAEREAALQRQALADACLAQADALDRYADQLQAELDARLAAGPPSADGPVMDLRRDSKGVWSQDRT